MANEEIAKRVTKIILDKLDVKEEQIVEGASFTDDLGADSLDRTELVMGLEDEFKIEIPDTVSEKFLTVGDVIKFLAEKQ
ncbi:MAG: acyl carrier protein [Fibromonadaceae bacterium]|jgi:acyl carrier protein|nr:acyl carrier protein [Fibromonadaceae bacterium]